jgi:ABC-type uncharacterized transport system substrate-binding protein
LILIGSALWHIHCGEKSTAMNRKLWLLAVLFLASFNLVEAQQPTKVLRIGWLVPGSLSVTSANLEAFRKELSALGYVEGKNIEILFRYAEGKPERLPELASELVRLHVAIILTTST